MKNIFFIFILLISLIGFSNSVNGYSVNDEENKCFELLNQAVKDDRRFNDRRILRNGDLSRVIFNENDSTTASFDSYSDFLNNRVENTNRSGAEKYFFKARRNNIGTIIGNSSNNNEEKNYFIISQISGFGKDSNFDFPLEPLSGEGNSFGDKYELGGKSFKEYLVYTHHLVNGDFLSCGIVKVKPLGRYDFSTVTENNYFTNVLNGNRCSSGFEGRNINKSGKKYYEMTSNICVEDHVGKDMVKLEVISIAYDNKSSYFNEYITHPLQVEAMKDSGNRAGGLVGVREAFLDKVDNTCLTLIHGELPERCKQDITGSGCGECKYGYEDTTIDWRFSGCNNNLNVPYRKCKTPEGSVFESYNNYGCDYYYADLINTNGTCTFNGVKDNKFYKNTWNINF